MVMEMLRSVLNCGLARTTLVSKLGSPALELLHTRLNQRRSLLLTASTATFAPHRTNEDESATNALHPHIGHEQHLCPTCSSIANNQPRPSNSPSIICPRHPDSYPPQCLNGDQLHMPASPGLWTHPPRPCLYSLTDLQRLYVASVEVDCRMRRRTTHIVLAHQQDYSKVSGRRHVTS